jgi:hypothetical protein
MRKIVKQVVVYRCKICRTDYKTIRGAMKCEALPVEPKKFKIGDEVKSRGLHVCDKARKEKYFLPKGRVVKITGPALIGWEYSWLGREFLNQHVYQYVVEYKCPCGEIREDEFYFPQLKLIKEK